MEKSMELKELEEKVDLILNLLQGNKINKKDAGIVGKVESLDDRVENLERWKDRLVWMVIGLSIPSSVGIMTILKTLFIK